MNTDTRKITLASTAVILLLIVGLLHTFGEKRAFEQATYTSFVDSFELYQSESLTNVQSAFAEDHPRLLGDCEMRSEYDAYLGLNSFTMSAATLRDALLLHEDCGSYFADMRALVLSEKEARLDELDVLASLLIGTKYEDETAETLQYAEDILALEYEQNALSYELVDIQEDFWAADLERATRTITFAEREGKVGALNAEARNALQDQEELQKELTDLKEEAAEYWSSL